MEYEDEFETLKDAMRAFDWEISDGNSFTDKFIFEDGTIWEHDRIFEEYTKFDFKVK